MKKLLMISYLMFFFLIVATCCENIEEKPTPVVTISMEQVDLVKAKKIIEETCQVCHSPTATMEDRLAPPLEAVKRRYLMAFPNIDDFTTNIAEYVAHPTKEKALMIGAVKRFNVMPPLAKPLPDEDLQAVATFIYQFELEKPAWFDAHYQQMHGNGNNGMGNRNGNGRGHGMRRGQGGD